MKEYEFTDEEWREISLLEAVRELLEQRQWVERQIYLLDEKALVNYELLAITKP